MDVDVETSTWAPSSFGRLKETLWRLIGVPAATYGMATTAVAAIVKCLLGSDHLPAALSELVAHLLDEEAVAVVRELMTELAGLAPTEMGNDSAGAVTIRGWSPYEGRRHVRVVAISGW